MNFATLAQAVVFLGLVVGLAGCGSNHGATSETPLFGSGLLIEAAEPSDRVRDLEAEMHKRVNRDRAEHGLPPLSPDDHLAVVARAHSEDMRRDQFFEHESARTGGVDDRLIRAGYYFARARENLALGDDVQRAEDELLLSPGHRANILSPEITHLGIGIVEGTWNGSDGVLFITQVFAEPVAILEPDEVFDALDGALGQRWSPDASLRASAEALLESGEEPSEKDLQTAILVAREAGSTAQGIGAIGGNVFRLEDALSLLDSVDDLTVGYGLATADVVAEDGRPEIGVLILIALP